MEGPATLPQHERLVAAISLLKIKDDLDFEYHVLRSIEIWREFERDRNLQALVEHRLREHGFCVPRVIINKLDFAFDLAVKINEQTHLEDWGTEQARRNIENNLTAWNTTLRGRYRAPAVSNSPTDEEPEMSVDRDQDSPQPGPSGLQAPPGQIAVCAPLSPQPGPSGLQQQEEPVMWHQPMPTKKWRSPKYD